MAVCNERIEALEKVNSKLEDENKLLQKEYKSLFLEFNSFLVESNSPSKENCDSSSRLLRKRGTLPKTKISPENCML